MTIRGDTGKVKTCLICSNKFYIGKMSTQKYCSVKCKNRVPAVEIKYICKDCKKEFGVLTKQPYRPPLYCKQLVIRLLEIIRKARQTERLF